MLRNPLLLLQSLFLVLIVPAPVVVQNNCDAYVMLQENASYKLLSYDKKDRQTGRATHKVKIVNRNDGKVEATIQNQSYDQKEQYSFQASTLSWFYYSF